MARQVPFSEFSSIFNFLQNQITWHCVHAVLKFELEGFNGGTSLELFEFVENSESRRFYIALKYHKFEKLVIVGNSSIDDENFIHEAVKKIFPLISKKLEAENLFETILPKEAHEEFGRQLKILQSHPYVLLNAAAHAFYIDEKKLNYCRKLPPEFEARRLEPRHADQMMSVLLQFQEGDSDQAAIRIKELPSMGIFEKSTNKLVAFEYTDGVGFIAHQYVYPEYRGKGFGKIVEILICQDIISKLKMTPLKAVAVDRPRVISMTHGSGYWKLIQNSKGEPAEKRWALYSKNPGNKIHFFDN